MQREEQNEFRRVGEVPLVLSVGTTLRKTISAKVGPHIDYRLQGNHRRLQQPGSGTLCKVVNRTVASLIRKMQKELGSKNSRIRTRTWMMNLNSEVCSSPIFPTESMTWIK